MFVANSQVGTGSKILIEEPIQSDVDCAASKLICANGKIMLWFTTFPKYTLDIRISPQWDCSPLMQGEKVSCHSTATVGEHCAETFENLASSKQIAVHDQA